VSLRKVVRTIADDPCPRAEATRLQNGKRRNSTIMSSRVNYGLRPEEVAASVPRCHDRFRRRLKKTIRRSRLGKRGLILQKYAGAVLHFNDFEAGSARRAFMARTRALERPRHLLLLADNGARRTYGSDFSEVAARAFKTILDEEKAPHRP